MAAQVALRRQQTSHNSSNEGATGSSAQSQINTLDYLEKVQNMEKLMAQKRAYQKHLKSLQQSSANRQLLQKGEDFIERTWKTENSW
jgi:hypothetical protein